MAYDPEKYREKREKVLGIKKRGIGFGTLATIVSIVIVVGLCIVTVPQAVSYISARNLDDAIFKLESEKSWPDDALESVRLLNGIKAMVKDKNDTRLVVTYDRRKVQVSNITNRFGRHNVKVILLNQVNHLQHEATMKDEEEDY